MVRRIVTRIQVVGGLGDLVAVVVLVSLVDGDCAAGIVGGLFANTVIGCIVVVFGGYSCIGEIYGCPCLFYVVKTILKVCCVGGGE